MAPGVAATRCARRLGNESPCAESVLVIVGTRSVAPSTHARCDENRMIAEYRSDHHSCNRSLRKPVAWGVLSRVGEERANPRSDPLFHPRQSNPHASSVVAERATQWFDHYAGA